MRSLLLPAAMLLALGAAAAELGDWRRADIDSGLQDELRGQGYGLAEGGRVLHPATREPLPAPEFERVLEALRAGRERANLERARQILAKAPPLSPEDAQALRTLRGRLPRALAAALSEGAGIAELRRLAELELRLAAERFDGLRSREQRREAAQPIRAGEPGRRVPLPYLDERERRVGEALRAAARAHLDLDPYAKRALAGYAGAPVLVEDLAGAEAAYDYRRRAVVLDRQAVIAALADAVPPGERSRLALRLAPRDALLEHLDRNPAAVAAVVRRADVAVFHEFAHGLQDERDPLLREMARGNLPRALLLEYEEEAWMMKNLYLHSKLGRDPGSLEHGFELGDYARMTADLAAWRRQLRIQYEAADPAFALDLAELDRLAEQRLELARERRVSTREQAEDKALDLRGYGRARRALPRLSSGIGLRLDRLRVEANEAAKDADARLARFHLGRAQRADDFPEFSAALSLAERHAARAGDPALAAKIRALREGRR